MQGICGADCAQCNIKEQCKGCPETCGQPRGGRCIAAQYIRTGGPEGWKQFKRKLQEEINEILEREGAPKTDQLYELPGSYVNLEYELPNGQKARFLEDRNIYVGCQVEAGDSGLCYGAVADMDFILVCRYGEGGSHPELVCYRRR